VVLVQFDAGAAFASSPRFGGAEMTAVAVQAGAPSVAPFNDRYHQLSEKESEGMDIGLHSDGLRRSQDRMQ
jgi:hypothetical protein